MGLRQVRVRHHDQVARLEVPPGDFLSVLAHAEEIHASLRHIRYAFVPLDQGGYRIGSLNESRTGNQAETGNQMGSGKFDEHESIE